MVDGVSEVSVVGASQRGYPHCSEAGETGRLNMVFLIKM